MISQVHLLIDHFFHPNFSCLLGSPTLLDSSYLEGILFSRLLRNISEQMTIKLYFQQDLSLLSPHNKTFPCEYFFVITNSMGSRLPQF